MVRGVRGAIQAEANEPSAILDGAETLINALVESNGIKRDEVSAVFFTVTYDLNACFPAAVRSRIGWDLVPFLCSLEIPVPYSLERIIRILILFDTERMQEEMQHQYLGVTASLRPDLRK